MTPNAYPFMYEQKTKAEKARQLLEAQKRQNDLVVAKEIAAKRAQDEYVRRKQELAKRRGE